MNKNLIIVIAIVAIAWFVMNSEQWYKMLGNEKPKPAVENQIPSDSLADTVAALLDTLNEAKPDSLAVNDSATATDSAGVTPVDTTPAKPVIEYRDILIRNSLLQLTISEKGGVVRSAKPLEFKYAKNHPKRGEIVELVDSYGSGIAGIEVDKKISFDTYFKYNATLSDSLKAVFDATVDGEVVRKSYALPDNSYYVDFNLNSTVLKGEEVLFSFGSPINETEDSLNRSNKYSPREVAVSNGKKVKITKAGKKKGNSFSQSLRWVSLSSKYFGMAAIMPAAIDGEVKIKNHYVNKKAEKKEDVKNKKVTGTFAFDNDESQLSMKLFFGPTQIKILKEANVKLEGIVYRGWGWFFGAHIWFPWICNFVNWLMGFFVLIFKDYGIAILLLTVILRVVTFPLTQASMKSMKQMKEIQPRIQEIQEKYKNNVELQRAKMMEFYQKEGINPLAGVGGCLPMFLQMPIMISLFVVLRKSVELRGETTFLVPWLQDLSQAEVLFKLPFEIPFYGSNFALLPLLYAGLMFFSNKQTMKDPAQASMVYVMPIVMLVMFNNFPSGLTMYFVFSNLLQLVQQHFVNKGDKGKLAKA